MRDTPNWRATTCDGKQAFGTKSMAERVASLSSGRSSIPMSAYQCRHCGKYHIGSRTSKPATYNRKPKIHFTEDDDQGNI